ncbi:hypothetical protein [Kitasatospora sp. NPDC087314]|uniref:hypothetical protein n=1 Tax=Kitasatospora sp. NPDC087314 TaxID=3364068 RepID=UPI003803C69A
MTTAIAVYRQGATGVGLHCVEPVAMPTLTPALWPHKDVLSDIATTADNMTARDDIPAPAELAAVQKILQAKPTAPCSTTRPATTATRSSAPPSSTILAVVVAGYMPTGRRPGTTNALTMSLAMGPGVPAQVLLIPLFVGVSKVNLGNDLDGLVLIHADLALPFTVHLLTVFFTGIPHVLEEATAIDGSRRRAHLRLDRAARHPRRAHHRLPHRHRPARRPASPGSAPGSSSARPSASANGPDPPYQSRH